MNNTKVCPLLSIAQCMNQPDPRVEPTYPCLSEKCAFSYYSPTSGYCCGLTRTVVKSVRNFNLNELEGRERESND